MVDGTYRLTLQTPIGTIPAKLMLVSQGESLSGSLEAMGHRQQFSGGKVQGDSCAFSTAVATQFGRISLQVQAKVQGSRLQATAHTSVGVIRAVGEKIGDAPAK